MGRWCSPRHSGGAPGSIATVGDPYVAPGKFGFLRCPDIATRLETAEARLKELGALMERSGGGLGGGAVNTFVYRPDMDGVEAELKALKATSAEKNCHRRPAEAAGQAGTGHGADPLSGCRGLGGSAETAEAECRAADGSAIIRASRPTP